MRYNISDELYCFIEFLNKPFAGYVSNFSYIPPNFTISDIILFDRNYVYKYSNLTFTITKPYAIIVFNPSTEEFLKYESNSTLPSYPETYYPIAFFSPSEFRLNSYLEIKYFLSRGGPVSEDINQTLGDLLSQINQKADLHHTHSFLSLQDTPTSYVGQSNKVIKVKQDESGLEFGTLSSTPNSFLELSDTPDSYTGQSNKIIKVKQDESGLEFSSLPPIPNSFLELSDTPNSYIGQSNKVIKVKQDESGLEFGSSTFLGLADTPNSYTGQSNKFVKVKQNESGLEFGTLPPIPNSFLELSDTPNSYEGHNEKFLVVSNNAIDFRVVNLSPFETMKIIPYSRFFGVRTTPPPPSEVSTGDSYFNDTTKELLFYNETSWIPYNWQAIVSNTVDFRRGIIRIRNNQLQIRTGGGQWYNCYPLVGAQYFYMMPGSWNNTTLSPLYYILPGTTAHMEQNAGINHIPFVSYPDMRLFIYDIDIFGYYGTITDNNAVLLKPSNSSLTTYDYRHWGVAYFSNRVRPSTAFLGIPLADRYNSGASYIFDISINMRLYGFSKANIAGFAHWIGAYLFSVHGTGYYGASNIPEFLNNIYWIGTFKYESNNSYYYMDFVNIRRC